MDEDKDVLVTDSAQVFDFSEQNGNPQSKTIQPEEEEKKLDETLNKKKDEKFIVVPKKEKSGLGKKKTKMSSKKQHETIDPKQNPSYKTTNSDLNSATTTKKRDKKGAHQRLVKKDVK